MSGDGFMLNFFKGDCIFVPAESMVVHMHGRAQLLNISC
jgi:mannose-6-phosphate isomerase